MIPTRYLGPIHALGLTFREEGARGCYRGFAAYMIATSIYLLVVPLCLEFGFSRTDLAGYQKDDTDDLYQSVMKNKRQK